MILLAIDTSGAVAGAALVDEYITIGEICIGRHTIPHGKTKMHSEILLPMIDQLFNMTGLTLHDVDGIACTNGPGSFTGLRIGAATAKGLACGAKKPLIPVPTLDAMAYNAGSAAAGNCIIVPIMDARRGQVYTAFYRWKDKYPQRISEYMAEDMDEILSKLASACKQDAAGQPPAVIFLGDGVPVHRDKITGCKLPYFFAPPGHNLQRAASVGHCAVHLFDAVQPEADFTLMYIRKPQAEREREERLARAEAERVSGQTACTEALT